MKHVYVLPASTTAIMVSFSPAAVVASSPSAPMFINFFPAPTSSPARSTFHSYSVAVAGAFCVWHHVAACYMELGPPPKWRLMVPGLICYQYVML